MSPPFAGFCELSCNQASLQDRKASIFLKQPQLYIQIQTEEADAGVYSWPGLLISSASVSAELRGTIVIHSCEGSIFSA